MITSFEMSEGLARNHQYTCGLIAIALDDMGYNAEARNKFIRDTNPTGAGVPHYQFTKDFAIKVLLQMLNTEIAFKENARDYHI